MKFASPALRTSFALLGPDTTFADRGEYVRVESPAQPQFYFGTLLAFHAPPGVGDGERWRQLFRSEFATNPNVRHETYVWEGGDGEPAALAAFLAAGLDYQSDEILACDRVASPRRSAADVRVRTVESDEDWRQARELETFEPPPGVNLESFRAFVAQRTASRRALVEAGRGHWFGAFLADGRLVANLGLFVVPDEAGDIARYQAVGTHANFRRRGIAATLMYEAAARIARERRPRNFVLVADPAGPAIGIYRSLGFTTIGRTWALFRGPDADPTGPAGKLGADVPTP